MTDEHDVLKPALWTARPVAETIAVYADWAATYDAEVTARGYRTPDRLAEALTGFVDPATPILDFGCGTGISGMALTRAGFGVIDGTDVTAQMLEKATNLRVYRKTWVSTADSLGCTPGSYDVIAAVGVISLGAAPAETLPFVLGHLAPGGLLALSFNDPTLADASYGAALQEAIDQGQARILFREHGPHLEDVGMGSDVIILRRL